MKRNIIPWRKRKHELQRVQDYEDPFELLHQQIDDLAEYVFQGGGFAPKNWLTSSTPSWFTLNPEVEVSETDNEVQIKAEIPGMNKKDIEIVLDENLLTIRGEKKDTREKKRRNVHVSELNYGQFQRSIQLPSNIDRDKIKTKFKRGVLTLTVPKQKGTENERRQIPVNTA